MKPYYEEKGITIYHGDCREILPSLPKVDLVLTDPPYGVGIPYGVYDDDPKTYWEWFMPWVEWVTKLIPTVVFTHKDTKHIKTHDWMGAWVKSGSGAVRVGNSCVIPTWEPIYMFGIHSYGTLSRGFPDTFQIRQNVGEAKVKGVGREKWSGVNFNWHPCPKPADLFLRLIECFGQGKENICDPFMGSGTTLRAAKDLGRKAIGIEIEEKYCEIAVKRLAQEVLPL